MMIWMEGWMRVQGDSGVGEWDAIAHLQAVPALFARARELVFCSSLLLRANVNC